MESYRYFDVTIIFYFYLQHTLGKGQELVDGVGAFL
jgi:hypothetical protein